MSKRPIDISELYDELVSKRGTYVLCFDIVGLLPVNEQLGHEAGDKVILEAFKRLNDAADENMTVFRIGGDEFAMITGSESAADAEQIALKILSKNNTPIAFGDISIPVSLRCGAYQMKSAPLRYHELFADLQQTIIQSRNPEKVTFTE